MAGPNSREVGGMSTMGITRVAGAIAIILFGIFGGAASRSAGLDVLFIFQMLNTVLLFIIMTFAYEIRGRMAP